MEPRFLVTLPVHVVVYQVREPVHPEVPESGYALQSAFTETGVRFIPIFTDPDLASRWIDELKLSEAKLHPLSDLDQLLAFLEGLLADGHTYVGYDPAGDSKIGQYKVFSIKSAIRDLRQQSGD